MEHQPSVGLADSDTVGFKKFTQRCEKYRCEHNNKLKVVGFLQDFAFVMLAKAREQMFNKVWNSSLELMLILDKELGSGNGNVGKLSRLISWEILLVQITQLLEEWPKSTIGNASI